jgi:UDP-N-acetylmuramoyl-L-alanyl-D-glutamate--2,6-diaminopimelate ligase
MSEMALRPTRVTPVSLAEVAQRCGLLGSESETGVHVTGATVSSRDVRAGDLFGALPGEHVHGVAFAEQAVRAGAVAVITDAAGASQAAASGVPVLVAEDARRAMALAAAAIYADPSHQLPMIGVTGTNGKTTTAFLIEGALSGVHPLTLKLGTVEMRIGSRVRESTRTTVEAPVFQGVMARAVELGATAGVAEVSSQAIALERVTGAHFDVAVFTNLQYEHLDYHGTMEEYFAQKARLFTPELSSRAVVLVDDDWGKRLARSASVPVETVATRPGAPIADWNVEDAGVAPGGGMAFTLVDPEGVRRSVVSPLPGAINVSNAAAAIVAVQALGVPVDDAIAGLAQARAVPGRTQVVTPRDDRTPMTVVDYAHTPDALASVLDAMKEITPGRVIVVFGCDGLRDDSKRPGLGAAAASHADVVIVTDENPRTEPAEQIRARILEGVSAERPDHRDVMEISPRSDAVLQAIRMAGPLDTVIATGKGHETTQEIDGVHYPYTDAGAFMQALAITAAEGDDTEGDDA